MHDTGNRKYGGKNCDTQSAVLLISKKTKKSRAGCNSDDANQRPLQKVSNEWTLELSADMIQAIGSSVEFEFEGQFMEWYSIVIYNCGVV